MPVAVICQSGKTSVRLRENSAGRQFRCPKCQGVIPGQGGPPPKKSVVRPAAQFDPGFVDSAEQPPANLPIDPPPISSAAREATRETYNPFADDRTEDEEEET